MFLRLGEEIFLNWSHLWQVMLAPFICLATSLVSLTTGPQWSFGPMTLIMNSELPQPEESELKRFYFNLRKAPFISQLSSNCILHHRDTALSKVAESSTKGWEQSITRALYLTEWCWEPVTVCQRWKKSMQVAPRIPCAFWVPSRIFLISLVSHSTGKIWAQGSFIPRLRTHDWCAATVPRVSQSSMCIETGHPVAIWIFAFFEFKSAYWATTFCLIQAYVLKGSPPENILTFTGYH